MISYVSSGIFWFAFLLWRSSFLTPAVGLSLARFRYIHQFHPLAVEQTSKQCRVWVLFQRKPRGVVFFCCPPPLTFLIVCYNVVISCFLTSGIGFHNKAIYSPSNSALVSLFISATDMRRTTSGEPRLDMADEMDTASVELVLSYSFTSLS